MVLMDAIILYFCAQPTQSDMKELVASFTAQLRQAVEIGKKQPSPLLKIQFVMF